MLKVFPQALILYVYKMKLNPSIMSCPNEMTRKKLLLFLKLIKTKESELDETTKKRRTKVAEMLNNRKDKKINQKLTSDAQFLNYAKEDLQLKRKLLDRLDKDSDFKESMTKINKTTERVGESISQSMMLLAQFLRPPNASHMPSPSMESQHMPHYVAYKIINHFTKLGKVQICIVVVKHRVVCLCSNNPLAIELGQAMILMQITLNFEM